MNTRHLALIALTLSSALSATVAQADTGKPLTRQEVINEYLRARAAGELYDDFSSPYLSYPAAPPAKAAKAAADAPKAPATPSSPAADGKKS